MSELVKDVPPAFSEPVGREGQMSQTEMAQSNADRPSTNTRTSGISDEDVLCRRLAELPLYRPPVSLDRPSVLSNEQSSLDSNESITSGSPQHVSTEAELRKENERLKAMIQELVQGRSSLATTNQSALTSSSHHDRATTLRLRDGTLARALGEGATVLYHPETMVESKNLASALRPPVDPDDEQQLGSPVVEALRRDVLQAYTPAAAAFHLSAQDPLALQAALGSASQPGTMEVVDFEEHQFAEMLAQQGRTFPEIQAAIRQRRRVLAEVLRRRDNPRVAKQAEQQELTWGESIVETGTAVASASARAVTMTARAAFIGAHAGYTAFSYASYLATRYPAFLPESQLAIARACCNALIATGIASTSPLLAYFVTKSPAGQYALQQLGLLVATISDGISGTKGEAMALAGDAAKAAAGYMQCRGEDTGLVVHPTPQEQAEELAQEAESSRRLKERIERNLPLRPDERVVEVRDAVIVPHTQDAVSSPSGAVAALPPLERADVEELAAFVGVAEDDWWVLVSAARHAQLRADALERRRQAIALRNQRRMQNQQLGYREDEDKSEDPHSEFEEVDELECLEMKEGRLDETGFIMDPQENRPLQQPPVSLFEKARRLLAPPLRYLFGSSEPAKPSNVTIVPMTAKQALGGPVIPIRNKNRSSPMRKSYADDEPIELQVPRDRRLQPPPPTYAESLGGNRPVVSNTGSQSMLPEVDTGRAYWSKVQGVAEREAQKRAVALMKGGKEAARVQAELDLELDEEDTSRNANQDADFVTVGGENLSGYHSPRALGYATTYTLETALAEDRAQRALAREAESESADAESRSRAELHAVNALADASLLNRVDALATDEIMSDPALEADVAELEEEGFVIVNDADVRASIEALLQESVKATHDAVFDLESEPPGTSESSDISSEEKKASKAAEESQVQRGNSAVQEAIKSFSTAKNVLMKHIQVGRWVCTVYYVGKVALKVFRHSGPAASKGAETVRMVLSCGLQVSYLLLRGAKFVLRR